ncbi:DUF6351 family protein [Egicoccus halophilus]|uniref:DUF6351 domain-containing protein n=1 Tax=Egicoccus halophilus TaxID=1670830 RepID=A0A8J3A8W5_9ACTN|nr:DUF6351 family protein [Egicoccus halophilus]GGI07045.1 hypothetical protein GCM10011354_22130 [Egicoccus halophilus]
MQCRTRRWRRGATILAVAGLFAATLPVAASASPERGPDGNGPPGQDRAFTVEALSTRADMVTGGDVLVGIDVPRNVPQHQVRVLAAGRDVSDAFTPDPSDPRRLVGLVEGLRPGTNTIRVSGTGNGQGRPTAALEVVNHPSSGPVFSGPHQTPFSCTTEQAGLGTPTDPATCAVPAQVVWYYRTTGGSFQPLADPQDRPSDLATTTTRDGRTVDYVVRVESGVINRSIYRFAVLAEGGEVGAGWNGGLVYNFGGGCGTGFHQGSLSLGTVLSDAELSRGLAVASGSLNVHGTACNAVLSAETAMMVKEHVTEELRTVPRWTMGTGGSGGAIQQHLIANDYPGILDGLVPQLTFQDSQLSEPADCRLLRRAFAGSGLSPAQQNAVTGYHTATSCLLWDLAFADVLVAPTGCSSNVPVAERYHPVTNPDGVRCTTFDSMINVWGADPETGFARRVFDNVGVQYGLGALQAGTIGVEQFLAVNERVGGFDQDGNVVGERSVADRDALEIAYATGQMALGGALSDVPILDVRPYTDPADFHTYSHTFTVRERLEDAFGHADNQVMWRAPSGSVGNAAMQGRWLDTMADWLDAIAADASGRPLAEVVVDRRPDDAVDSCWTREGERILEVAEYGVFGQCETLMPPAATPRIVAGSSVASDVIACTLRPVDLEEYGVEFTPTQHERLHSLFPDGVCDWEAPSVGQVPFAGTWPRY